MLTRVCKAKDWGSGIELTNHLLGYMSRLEIHHIFPKSLLYKFGYTRPEVNAIANFTFLTKDTNLAVLDKDPADYLVEYSAKNPGAIESHWIPMDRNLWKIEKYREFLSARRELLAKAANSFLDSLLNGAIPETPITESFLDKTQPFAPGGFQNDEEQLKVQELNDWITEQGLPEGQELFELTDPSTGKPLAVIDLAWPKGLQQELSQPVAILLDEEAETMEMVNHAGYKSFTDIKTFRQYVEKEILALA
jgi:hypothetical protein